MEQGASPSTTYARQTYEEMEVFGADPKRLVVMLFEAAHRFLLQAREAMERKHYEGQADYIIKAQKIYVELLCALNEETGGILALSLKQLYGQIHELLRQACIYDDLDKLDEAIASTEQLTAAWREAEARCKSAQT